jgi:hypothetical protein
MDQRLTLLLVTVDGAMLASRDFGFMLMQGLGTTCLQLFLLANWCKDISDIYATFTIRLGWYALASLLRVGLGFGPLGRVLRTGSEAIQINGSSAEAVNP